VATAIFLGGWSGPGAAVGFWTSHLGMFWGNVVFNIIAVFWFVTKMVVLLVIFQWIRATLPRLRADQLMRYAWLFLMPLTLFNIVLTGALLLLPIGSTLQLVAAGAANWLLMFVVIFGFRRVTGLSPFGRLPRWMRTTGRGGRGARRVPTKPQPQPPELAGVGRQ
jgi:NADH-quinone oxidoreductase subunit H